MAVTVPPTQPAFEINQTTGLVQAVTSEAVDVANPTTTSIIVPDVSPSPFPPCACARAQTAAVCKFAGKEHLQCEGTSSGQASTKLHLWNLHVSLQTNPFIQTSVVLTHLSLSRFAMHGAALYTV